MLIQFQPVLADLGAIIQAIIFLVILASGAARMFRESKEVQRRVEQQRPRRRLDPLGDDGPEVARVPGDKAPGGQQQAVRSEVEEFLRRVEQEDNQQQAGGRGRRSQERQPRIEVLDKDSGFEDSGFEIDERPRQSHRKKPRPQRPAAPVAKVQSLPPAAPPKGIERGETVAAHVEEHLQRGKFAERASHMGEELSHTDERLEARLHEKFDHKLGNLSARRAKREATDLAKEGDQAAPTLAEDLLTMLSTPQGVQKAVILSEVLRRPSESL